MDKSWIDADRDSSTYGSGVEKFLSFAKENATDRKNIPCPCSKCINLKKYTISDIRSHLFFNGFYLGYENWIWHGEIHNDSTRDTSSSSFSTPLAECETEDMCRAAFKEGDYDEDSFEFNKFVTDAQQPLYANSEHTKLESLVQLYNLKARFALSDACFTKLLSIIGSLLPKDNVLPQSMYEARMTSNNLGLQYEKIHACPNDCILYRKEYVESSACPKCGLSRWKLTDDDKVKVGQPAKVLWYFRIIPQFKRMFKSAETSKLLTWHNDSRIKDNHMRHPADSPSWKLIDYMWPEFSKESRNLRLALSADGINPHRSLSSRYSCWPVILVTYNLPPWLSMKRKHMILSLLVFGRKQPGNDIDIYLAPLIEDLCTMWNGVENVFDAHRKEHFTLRAVLMWTINDFPAYGNLSGCTTKGFKACPICGDNTSAIRLPYSSKMSFGFHRKYLPKYHPYRRQKKSFNNKQELTDAPVPLSGEEVLERVNLIDYEYASGLQR